jgi:hypothetical protein
MKLSRKTLALCIGITCFGAAGLVAFCFIPATFVVIEGDQFRYATFGESRVVGYGYSRLSQITLGDGPQFSERSYRGRCFVDVETGDHIVREWGWFLDVRTYYDRDAERRFRKVFHLQ